MHNIPGTPPGAYWDGGITDYHLHLHYAPNLIAVRAYRKGATGTFHPEATAKAGLVLYPHFQKAVVPGWLDKGLKWRHGATHFLDRMVLLAPDPQWIKTLPNGKLPDRSDFTRYGTDLQGRVKAWRTAAAASEQLAEEWQGWLQRPELGRVERL